MAIYRPRMHARLIVPFPEGEEQTLDVLIRVRAATLSLNNHNAADELEIEAAWGDVGVDPRFVRACAIQFYMGDADEFGSFTPDATTFRFAGIADKVERIAKDEQTIRIQARDYTALFLQTKDHFPAAGIPTMGDTLLSAWQRICDHTGFAQADKTINSSVAILRDRLEFRGGVNPETKLRDAVSSRFARLGNGTITNEVRLDAWAVWQRAVGMLGLVSFIDRDRCVVTTSADQFAEDPGGTPRLVWGRNIIEMSEAAIPLHDRKGILLSSFDPLTGKTIEVTFNPDEKRKKEPHAPKASGKGHGRAVATKRTAAMPAAAPPQDYEPFEYHGVSDPGVLRLIAERTWMERAQQELEGSVTTHEMFVATDAERLDTIATRRSFDVLSIRSGDSIRIEIDPLDEGVFSKIASDAARAQYLVERGYNPIAAKILSARAGRVMQLGRTFKVRSARIHLSADGDAGEFSVQLQYVNRIEIRELVLSEAEQRAALAAKAG